MPNKTITTELRVKVERVQQYQLCSIRSKRTEHFTKGSEQLAARDRKFTTGGLEEVRSFTRDLKERQGHWVKPFEISISFRNTETLSDNSEEGISRMEKAWGRIRSRRGDATSRTDFSLASSSRLREIKEKILCSSKYGRLMRSSKKTNKNEHSVKGVLLLTQASQHSTCQHGGMSGDVI